MENFGREIIEIFSSLEKKCYFNMNSRKGKVTCNGNGIMSKLMKKKKANK